LRGTGLIGDLLALEIGERLGRTRRVDDDGHRFAAGCRHDGNGLTL